MMQTMRISIEGSDYILTSRGQTPVKCVIANLKIDEHDPVLRFNVDWISKGKYSNYQCKKMVARTMVRLLKAAAAKMKESLKHGKDSHV